VSANFVPEANAPKAMGKGASATVGAVKGLGFGLAMAAMCPLAIAGLQFGGGDFLLACLGGAATPVFMVVGAVEGGKAWISEEIEAQGKTLLSDALKQGQMQHLLTEQVIKATQVKVSRQVVSLEEGVAKVLEEQVDYRHLASHGIDTVLEVSLVSIGFLKGESEEANTTTEKVDESKEDPYEEIPPFSLTMAARVRAIRVSNNESLSDVAKNFTSEKRKWSEWVVKQDCAANEHCVVKPGQAFGEAIEEGHQTLARQIVDETFPRPDSPAGTKIFRPWPAPSALMTNMTPTNLSVSSHHPRSVSVSASAVWEYSEIPDEAFQGAIEAAIRESQVFSQIVSVGGADYHLEVVVKNFYRSRPGFNMTTTLTTNWELTKQGATQATWQDFIATQYTATLGDAFIGQKRARMANEGAARKNIEEGIRRLSKIDL
jgi:hypothetical protein